MKKTTLPVALLGALLFFEACVSQIEEEPVLPPTSIPVQTPAPTQAPIPPPLSGLQDAVDYAKKDLVKRLGAGVSENDIKITMAMDIDFPDKSLRCVKKNQPYSRVYTPVIGYLVILSYQGTYYPYHSTIKGPPFLCEYNISNTDVPIPDLRIFD